MQRFQIDPIRKCVAAITLALIATSILASVALAVESDDSGQSAPDFNRQVRPILAKHCFTCHGPDEGAREAGLRLDTFGGATEDRGGYRAVDSTSLEDSELWIRATSDDPDLRMPPSESHPALSEADQNTLKSWIENGGRYETHWAFVSPVRPIIPDPVDSIGPAKASGSLNDWSRNPLDAFVLDEMVKAGLRPSPTAKRQSMVRRLYLDLTGVNPSPDVVADFLADQRPGAYQRLVDRLLASPDYAERFTRPWLDLARYSDTNGYEKDRPRTIWPYRDWVIEAIANDMPFDEFSIKQLAGDMLPNATVQDRIATGFHRNTMLNEEGGIDPNEFRHYAVNDRVATTGTIWMGLTTGCAQCHTHKYDPITHTDYYSLFALLNGADEPELEITNEGLIEKQRQIKRQIDEAAKRLVKKWLPDQNQLNSRTDESRTDESNTDESNTDESNTDEPNREPNEELDKQHQAFSREVQNVLNDAQVWQVITPVKLESTLPDLAVQDDGSIYASGDVTKRDVYTLEFDLSSLHNDLNGKPITALRLEALADSSLPAAGPGLAFYEGRRGEFFLSEMMVTHEGQDIELKQFSHNLGSHGLGSSKQDPANVADSDGSSGWSGSLVAGQNDRMVANFASAIPTKGTLKIELLFERHYAAALGRFRFSVSAKDETSRSTFLTTDSETRVAKREDPNVLSPVMYAEVARQYVMHHHQFKKHRGSIEKLRKRLPKPVRTLVMKQRPSAANRTTRRHHRGEYLSGKEEVTPAIPVVFGTLDPSEPADRMTMAKWLVSQDNPLVARVVANRAWREFFGTGIVRTAGDFGTQSEPPSHPELLDYLATDLIENGWSIKHSHRTIVMSATYRQAVGKAPDSDPDNRLLSVFSHRRISGEQIRDSVLSASGIMTRTVGGPSVYPPQPAGVNEMGYGSPKWETSSGPDRYRRSLYTFSKRTAPFAALLAFDGPSGELCIARRDRSTTPLQALTLLNDAMYIEIADALAKDVLHHADDPSPSEIATEIFVRLLSRKPTDTELDSILAFYDHQSKREDAWMLVARAIMNTDEAITTP